MSINKNQKQAMKRYVQKHDRLEILLPKGAKAILKEHTDKLGISMTKFADRALQRAIKNDRIAMAEYNTKTPAMHKPKKKSD